MTTKAPIGRLHQTNSCRCSLWCCPCVARQAEEIKIAHDSPINRCFDNHNRSPDICILLCFPARRGILETHLLAMQQMMKCLYLRGESWWRHQMETFSALLAFCAGNKKGQWRGALMFSLICVWINDWVNNREAGDLRRYRAHYDVTVMMNQIYWRSLFGFQAHLISK